MRILRAVENHAEDYLKIEMGDCQRVRLTTYMGPDGQSRLPIERAKMDMNVSEGPLSTAMTITPSRKFSLEEGKKLIDQIHAKTHLHPTSLKLLLQRNHKWLSPMWNYAHFVLDNCQICIRVGDPRPSRKVSFTKLHAGFNDHVFIDILYWNDRYGQHLIRNAVDLSTSYSRLGVLLDRSISQFLSVFERIWLHCNGKCMRVISDPEFHNDAVQKWFNSRGIELSPVPARRHNKAGVVERKNRIIKNILERLDADPQHSTTNIVSRLSLAELISNIMYGNQTASAFEMARGFIPVISELSAQPLPDMVRVAYEETHARRLPSRIMKSRPSHNISRDIYEVGERVLVLVPGGSRKRGHWIETTVEVVTADGHIECGRTS